MRIYFYSKFVLVLFIIFIGLLFTVQLSAEEGVYIHFDNNNQKLTLDLNHAPLEKVIDKVKKETHVWVEGEKYLTDKIISAKLNALPLEECIKRLLKAMNYSLEFDDKGNLLGVIIVGVKGGKNHRSPRIYRRPRYRQR